jgi:hypothetical protein
MARPNPTTISRSLFFPAPFAWVVAAALPALVVTVVVILPPLLKVGIVVWTFTLPVAMVSVTEFPRAIVVVVVLLAAEIVASTPPWRLAGALAFAAFFAAFA